MQDGTSGERTPRKLLRPGRVINTLLLHIQQEVKCFLSLIETPQAGQQSSMPPQQLAAALLFGQC